jgi:catechol 2,3-dioxygenase-like lactoylglutathione lyase family enzyme
MKHFPVCEIQSVDIGVPDVPAAERFYTAAWGLELAERRGDVVYLRASGDDPYVLALHPRPQPAMLWVTFGVAAVDVLARLADSVIAAHGKVLRTPGANAGPEGGTALTINTPEGYVLRFVHGSSKRSDGSIRKGLPNRLSHVNINCRDIEATRTFFERVIGLSLTDRSAAMAFLRCNHDHHVVVLADSGVDGLNHIAFMMPDFDSLMRGVGRMADHGYPVGWGVGRHGPGDNIFAYFIDPFGIVIEHTAEVLQVNDTYHPRGPEDWKWPPGRTDQWGVAPPKAESVKHAQLAIKFADYNLAAKSPSKAREDR